MRYWRNTNYIRNLFLLAGVIISFAFIGCTDESIQTENPNNSTTGSGEFEEFELPGFIGVQLKTSDGTRAEEENSPNVGDEFKAGEINEYAVAPSGENETYHFVLLYDEIEGKLQMVMPLYTKKLYPGDNKSEDNLETALTLSVKTVYKSTDYDYKDGNYELNKIDDFKDYLDDMKAYVLVNFDKSQLSGTDSFASNEAFLETLSNVENLFSIEYKDYKINKPNKAGVATDYFTMSSTIYLSSSTPTPATVINSDNIYFTADNALTNLPTIKGYVERLAVKYELYLTRQGESGEGENYQAGEANTLNVIGGELNKVNVFSTISSQGDFQITTIPYSWKVIVDGYGVNALEPIEYLFKKISDTNYFNEWNSQVQNRSYWSEDPHYEIAQKHYKEDGSFDVANSEMGYPHQYRAAWETDTIRSYVNTGIPRFLDYYSYDYFRGKKPEVFYSLENTYNECNDDGYYFDAFNTHYNATFAKGIGPNNFYTAGTHFIVACHLQIGTNSSTRDIYRDEDDIYYFSKERLLQAKLTLLNDRDLIGGSADIRVINVDWMQTGGDHQADLRIITWEKGARLYIDDREATVDDLDLIPAQISGGDGKVMIAPKVTRDSEGKVNDNKQFSLKAEGKPNKPISYNELVSLFHKFNGVIDYFCGGRMYYCAPVTHSVPSLNNYPKAWKTLGNVGAVRNNWYKITVAGVRAPGHSVAVASDPIIPMLDKDRDYISSRIRVFRWHEVTSTVTPIPGE